jgi:hypothetical protein
VPRDRQFGMKTIQRGVGPRERSAGFLVGKRGRDPWRTRSGNPGRAPRPAAPRGSPKIRRGPPAPATRPRPARPR